MEKKIVFICQEVNFTTNALVKMFENDGFVVSRLPPNADRLAKVQNMHDVVLYADGAQTYDVFFLRYLRDLMLSFDPINLYIIGTDNEFTKIFSIIERNKYIFIYKRPVNAKEIIADINGNRTEEVFKRILVVDDDSIMLRTIKNWLSNKYTVFMANSGMNAISFLAQNTVDLILLDYEMPVVSGLQVFQMLRSEERTKNIPIAFLTAKDDKETVMKVLEAKPDMYLLKSMAPVKLVKCIDDFFTNKSEKAEEDENLPFLEAE